MNDEEYRDLKAEAKRCGYLMGRYTGKRADMVHMKNSRLQGIANAAALHLTFHEAQQMLRLIPVEQWVKRKLDHAEAQRRREELVAPLTVQLGQLQREMYLIQEEIRRVGGSRPEFDPHKVIAEAVWEECRQQLEPHDA